MIGIATPHLAEDWWSQLGGEGLLAGHVMDEMQAVSEEDQALLDGDAANEEDFWMGSIDS